MGDLEEKCIWHKIAILERNEERSGGFIECNTMCYQDVGCYRCDGYDADCKAYFRQEDREE